MEIKYEFNDFIGVYSNLYPQNFCQTVVDRFEDALNTGAGRTRQQLNDGKRHSKDDISYNGKVGLGDIEVPPDLNFPGNVASLSNVFFHGLQVAFEHYCSFFSILENINIKAQEFKLQKTLPGGGYHIWHFEQGGMTDSTSARAMVYLLYLNTLDEEEGGETEFLYQRKRYRPIENTLIIWPASYTHTHRGNTVLGNKSKYVATGWFYLI